MPPFSGKQKKKQLQEKRQRKQEQRKRLDEKEGHDDDLFGQNDLQAHPREGSSDRGQTSDTQRGREEYKYGADHAGIRSVFLKETADEIAERKKRTFECLKNRNFMGPDGIPFGKWFDAPGPAAPALMPFSVEIPTRGWALRNSSALKTAITGKISGIGESGSDDDSSEEKEGDAYDSSENPDINAQEEERFRNYLHAVDNYPLPEAMRKMQISSYERNIDVWRQLWRTVEQSHVVVLVTDARYPIVHLPISLLYYVVRECRKACVIVLNKADLIPRHILDKWISFLQSYFVSTGVLPASVEEATATGVVREIPLIPFTALPSEETAFGTEQNCNAAKRRKKKNRRNKLYEQLRTGKLQVSSDDDDADGTRDERGSDTSDDDDDERGGLCGAVDTSAKTSVSKSSRGKDDGFYAATENFKGMRKAERELQQGRRDHKELQIVSNMITSLLKQCRDIGLSRQGISRETGDKATHCDVPMESRGEEENDGGDEPWVNVGFVGYPNVGKSSLLNCIRGTKVVSVSSTAGHTKHLQTIPIPSEHVVLIDSPGLAFPVFGLPRPLQAVFGTHQIAQTRDPQSGVAYLATHLHLERLYGLRRSCDYDDDASGKNNCPYGAPNAWSPYEICESYAKKKGYFVKRGKGALDIHRGAIELLQEAFEGRIVLFLAPPEVSWLQSAAFLEEVRPYLLLRAAPLVNFARNSSVETSEQ
uniref:Guanine nucleotide-binding protein-like 1 n=1 Tax=Trypanosoma congolense (strain IL3000) TaxID=1068625 RepID=G0UPB7_TRYCI|nr:putative GTP-binding protein [Trypanosoma congolense IL3000]